MTGALYTIWTKAFGELPFIRALIAPGAGDYPRYMEALLVSNKELGSLQYRFDKSGDLFGMSLDMPSTIDPNIQQLRLSALNEPSQIQTEGLKHLTLVDPTSSWNWQKKLRQLVRHAPPALADWALKAESIWRQVIFPSYKRSHYGILSRFLRSPILCLPEFLAAEGLTKIQDFHRASTCIHYSAVYRRVKALSGLPGLAAAVENHSIHELAREGHRPPDKTSILYQLTEAIDRAIPNPEITRNGRQLSRSAVNCLIKLDPASVRRLGHNLDFIVDVLLNLPPHLYPKTHKAQHNFCLYFCALQSGRSRALPLTHQSAAIAAACRQFELRTQPPPQFEAGDLNGLVDFIDWVLGMTPPIGSEDDQTAAWHALGRPTLTRLLIASAQWHDALVDATAALEAAENRQKTDENSASPYWPALLAGPTTVNDFQFECLNNPTALRLEGLAMSHCVSSFVPHCLMGSHILSVKHQGERAATITVESKNNNHTEWELTECSGPRNCEPEPEALQASRELVLKMNSKAIAPNPEVLTFQYERPEWSSLHRDDIFQELVSLQRTETLERFARLLRCGKKTTPASESFINFTRDAFTNQLGHRSSSAIG